MALQNANVLLQNYHEDEAENSLLHDGQNAPYQGPFDENHAQIHDHPIRESPSYSLTESYQSGYQTSQYTGSTLEDPGAAFGVVGGRAPSPYARSETSSTEAWRERQQQTTTGLKRYQTRKVKLVHGNVLSVDYPVPSAIQNSVQAKYRADLEGGSEEFTHMRCTHAHRQYVVV